MAHASKFPLGEARKLVSDLFVPQPWIYWTDFLITLGIAYSAVGVFRQAELFSPVQFLALAVAAIGLYRLSLFMHEIVHFRRGEMTRFKVAWNLLAGIPMLTPSFLYESHLSHHNTHHYGTGNDGEYLPLSSGRYRDWFLYFLQPVLLPIYVVLRFLIVTPISFLHPQLRRWTLERMSALVINLNYRREIPENAPFKTWAAVEAACFLRVLGFPIGVFAFGLPWTDIFLLYWLAVTTLTLNHIRTLVAHRYQSDGDSMTHLEQIADSVNISGRTPLVALLFPVGLRYHALHHLFPSLPYHNLGKAHRRLIASLPPDSAYHQATYPTYWAAVSDLLRLRREAVKEPPTSAMKWYSRRQHQSRAVPAELASEPQQTSSPTAA